MIVWPELTWENDIAPLPETRPTCIDCRRELVDCLDRYWGRDGFWGQFCVKCRTRRGCKL